jgi:hypothetical protein
MHHCSGYSIIFFCYSTCRNEVNRDCQTGSLSEYHSHLGYHFMDSLEVFIYHIYHVDPSIYIFSIFYLTHKWRKRSQKACLRPRWLFLSHCKQDTIFDFVACLCKTSIAALNDDDDHAWWPACLATNFRKSHFTSLLLILCGFRTRTRAVELLFCTFFQLNDDNDDNRPTPAPTPQITPPTDQWSPCQERTMRMGAALAPIRMLAPSPPHHQQQRRPRATSRTHIRIDGTYGWHRPMPG